VGAFLLVIRRGDRDHLTTLRAPQRRAQTTPPDRRETSLDPAPAPIVHNWIAYRPSTRRCVVGVHIQVVHVAPRDFQMGPRRTPNRFYVADMQTSCATPRVIVPGRGPCEGAADAGSADSVGAEMSLESRRNPH